MELDKKKAEEIAQGYFKFFQEGFPAFSQMGYLQIQIYKRGDGVDMSLCFGAGWSNTPWHDDLMKFVTSTNRRVKRKYSFFKDIHLCGYASMGEGLACVGGLLDEQKLVKQMRYPEKD